MSTPATTDIDATREEDWDWTFSLLTPLERRQLLAILASTESEIELSELSRELSTREAVRPGLPVSDERFDPVEVSLYHTHLPKLAEEGVVNWSADRQTVSLTDRARSHPLLLALARWSDSGTGVPSNQTE